MAIERSSSRRIADLVRELSGEDAVKREAAVARLTIAGARAVDPVLKALASATPATQVTALRVLAGLEEPRTLEPAIALLRSPHPQVVEAAIGAVRTHLMSESADTASRAIGALTAVCVDRRREDAVRLAALEALSDIGAALVAPLRDQLRGDPSARVRRAASAEAARDVVGAEAAAARLEAASIEPGDDPQLVWQWVREGAGLASLATLHQLILTLRERERGTPAAGRGRWSHAIGAAHLALAGRESRLAVFDLRDALEHGPGDGDADIIASTARVGDASCLEPLGGGLAAFARPDNPKHDRGGRSSHRRARAPHAPARGVEEAHAPVCPKPPPGCGRASDSDRSSSCR